MPIISVSLENIGLTCEHWSHTGDFLLNFTIYQDIRIEKGLLLKLIKIISP